MLKIHLAADIKHPDNCTRKDHLKRIASFLDESDAMRYWLQHAPRISKKVFNEQRGF